MKKMLIVAGVLNFITIMIMGYSIEYDFLNFTFLLCSGITYIYLATNDEVFINKKPLLVLGILNLFLNFISGLIVLISLDKKFDFKNNQIQTLKVKEKIDPETRKIDILLKLGVSMVIVSGIIFATTSWKEVSGILKFIFLLFLSITFYLLYFFSEIKLKIKHSAYIYFNLANLFLIFSFIAIGYFALLGPWFSILGEGSNIYWASLSLFCGLVATLVNMMYPKKEYKLVLYTSLVATIYLLLNHFSVDLEVILVLISVMASMLTLFEIKGQKQKYLIQIFGERLIYILGFVFVIYSAYIVNNYIAGVLALIIMYNLFILVKSSSNYIVDFTTAGLLLIIPFIFLDMAVENYQLASVIMGGIVSSIYILSLGMYSTPEKKFYLNTVAVISNIILLLGVLSLAAGNDVIEATILATMSISTYGIYVFLNKYDGILLVESKFKLIKIVALVYAIIKLLNFYIMDFSSAWVLIITTTIFLMLYLFSKKDQIGYLVSFIVLLIISSIFCIHSTDKIMLLLLLGLSSAPFIISYFNKEVTNKLKIPAFVYFLAMNYYAIIWSITFGLSGQVSSSIVIIVFSGLSLLLKKSKTLSYIALFALLIPFQSLLYHVKLDTQIKLILQMSWHLYLAYVFCNKVLKKNQTKNIASALMTSLIILSVIFMGGLLVGIYIGLVSLLLIVIGYSKPDYNYLFATGIAITILNIIYQLSSLNIRIPLWGYLLVSGLGLIVFVSYKELQKS